MNNSNLTSRQNAVETARKVLSEKPVYLDTETTGLNATDEIIEIAVVDHEGQILVDTLVRPSQTIPSVATRIHDIRNEDVSAARPWPIVWQQIQNLLSGRVVVMYNDDFDVRMMRQSHAKYKMPWRENFSRVDLLKLYAQFYGEWDPIRRAYRSHSLANAGKYCNIDLPNAHRSAADSLLTRELLLYIANYQGQ